MSQQQFNLSGTLITENGMQVSQNGNVLTVTGGAPPVVTSVVVSGPAVVQEGNTAQYSAEVLGLNNPSQQVTWSASDGSISPAGVFTGPMKQESVDIKATSVADPSKSGTTTVSIANSSNTVTISPSGGDDTSALQAALNKLTSGEVLKMLLGTWHLSPIFNPANSKLLITAASMVTDNKGYGKIDCMFNLTDGAQIDGTGAFVQMPNSFAASMNDGSEYRHAFRITGKNPAVTGISVSQAGGDGFYGVSLVGGSLQKVAAAKCFRNGCSLTDNVNGFLVASCILGEQAGGDKVIQCSLDLEPNPTGANQPCIVTLSGNQFLNNKGFPISNGLRLSLNNLNPSNDSVKVIVNNNIARGNAVDYKNEWPSGYSDSHRPAGWIITGSGNVDSNGPTSYPN